MTKKIERTRNTYDSTTGASVALNTSTYTQLLAANDDRLGYMISNDTAQDVLVNENGLEDFLVPKRSLYETEPDNIFTGELTAKSVTATPTVRVVER